MELIADVLLAAGAFGAGLYCFVLSRRLRGFATLETGMGGAIAVLSAQVEALRKALAEAQSAAQGSVERLGAISARAEAGAQRIELLLASLHDLPDPASPARPRRAEAPTADVPGPAPASHAPAAPPAARAMRRMVLERRRAAASAAGTADEGEA
jgi:hypothetical protein